MTEVKHRYCDYDERCENAGDDCDHCTRSYYHEKAGDCFSEKEE